MSTSTVDLAALRDRLAKATSAHAQKLAEVSGKPEVVAEKAKCVACEALAAHHTARNGLSQRIHDISIAIKVAKGENASHDDLDAAFNKLTAELAALDAQTAELAEAAQLETQVNRLEEETAKMTDTGRPIARAHGTASCDFVA